MKNQYNVSGSRWLLLMVWVMSMALSAQAQTVQPPVIEWQRVVEATNLFYGNIPELTKTAIIKNSRGGVYRTN